MPVHAWKAGPHEARIVARLLVRFRDHLGYDWPSDNAFLAGVERLIEERDTEYLLAAADEDSPPSGVVQLRFRRGIWRAGGDCLVEDVYVADEARGRGVARALLELATERALERGCRRMELDVNEGNEAGLALYESFGFRSSSEPGAPRDLYMRRHLDEGPEA
ncbi:MAG TPA: GNAT family N-acetyltransferase [Baekduia sp.]|uniref:GNAT family N-acetyltransferase n=1 Tax=Baekduia sp. TaxID=2600305 RepID=UPI002C9553BB|nr:GNAT family N-acetyltransferase [Baekduia sp.]HMJ35698.1 GNAT family N-acetyltransferase [Baekduia sp.]